MKNEFRVYVCHAESLTGLGITAEDIDDWNQSEILPSEAIEFIDFVEKTGRVYSLSRFQNAFNIEEGVSESSDYIFITNKYSQ